MRRKTSWTAIVLVLALGGCSGPAAPPGQALVELSTRCVEAMVRSTCRALGSEPAAGAGVIFVAGVGAVDANAYRQLRSSGEAMCAMAEQQCRAGWDSPGCRTARSLWLTASLASR